MRISTLVILAGALLFVLPVPGTFIGGGVVVAAGVALRLLGE
ncbi:hypothetical protein [Halobellus captivus]|nr:hypothetical protein [Halobellus captivus]